MEQKTMTAMEDYRGKRYRELDELGLWTERAESDARLLENWLEQAERQPKDLPVLVIHEESYYSPGSGGTPRDGYMASLASMRLLIEDALERARERIEVLRAGLQKERSRK